MNYIKPYFYEKSGDLLSPSAACFSLRRSKFHVNYHTKGNASVFLVAHANPQILSHPIIFEYPSFRIIVDIFRVNYSCPANLKDAIFYELRDGTTVYLYYFADEWLLASSRSVNIGYTEVRGHKLWDLFNECAPGLVASLDTTKSYSLGFTNTKIHHSRDGNALWNNNFDSQLEQVPLLKETDKISDNSDKYGTLIVVPSSKARYIVYGHLMRGLKNLKYDKQITIDVALNNYEYDKYVALRAWLKSDKAFQSLLLLEKPDEVDKTRAIAEQASKLLETVMQSKKNSKIFCSEHRADLIRSVRNIEPFYEFLFRDAMF